MVMRIVSVAIAMAMAMAIIVMSGSLLQGTEAQAPAPGVSCVQQNFWVPVSDANTMVQALRLRTDQCCKNQIFECLLVANLGAANAYMCGSDTWCMPCSQIGEYLNQVLAQCQAPQGVMGVYDINGGYGELVRLASG